MNITHTWIVKRLTQINNGTGTVSEVSFKIVSKDTDSENSVAFVLDETCKLNTEDIDIENFIPYGQLNQELVIKFIKDTLGEDNVKKLEASNVKKIQNKLNPPASPVIVENLPWS